MKPSGRTPRRPYQRPLMESGEINLARAAHCGQCDEGNTGVAFTEIHPSACDSQPQSNS